MIIEKAVLILGAGASHHLGYPTGKELVSDIICGMGNRNADAYKRELDFINHLNEINPPNIDSFLSYQEEEFQEVGKERIAEVILHKENRINNFQFSISATNNSSSDNQIRVQKTIKGNGDTRFQENNWYNALLDYLICQKGLIEPFGWNMQLYFLCLVFCCNVIY